MMKLDRSIFNEVDMHFGTCNTLWHDNFIDPFVHCYKKAHERYVATCKLQLEADKKMAELAFGALSLCGGTIYAAAVGGVAFKTVVGDAIVNIIYKKKIEKALRVASIIHGNYTAQFAIGKAWDAGATWLKNKAREAFAVDNAGLKMSGDPDDVSFALESYYSSCFSGFKLALTDLQYAQMPDHIKFDKLQKMFSSSFCKPAGKNAVPTNTHDKIELGFFLRDMLNSDSYINRNKKVPVTELPLTHDSDDGSDDYTPNPKYPTEKYTGKLPGVFYEPIGEIMTKQINELYRKVFQINVDLIEPSFWEDLGVGNLPNRAVLENAQKALEKLGVNNINSITSQNSSPGIFQPLIQDIQRRH
jgi:hypothetical protein